MAEVEIPDEDDFDLDDLINAHSVKKIKNSNVNEKDVKADSEENKNEADKKSIATNELLDSLSEFHNGSEESVALDHANEGSNNNTVFNSSFSSILDYAKFVIDKINEQGLPPTPENYQIYFIEYLSMQTEALQNDIHKIMKKEKVTFDLKKEKEFEQTVDLSLKLTHQILNLTTKVHNNINVMRNIINKREEELDKFDTADIVKMLSFDLEKLDSILERQSSSMKNIYSRSVETVNKIHKKTIFNQEFGVYNKRYFVESLNNELEKMQHFNFKSSVALIIPHRNLIFQENSKLSFIVAKSISKVLLSTFSQSDIVSYYNQNIFAVLLTHADIEKAKEKIEKLILNLRKSSLFITGVNIELRVKIGLTQLSNELDLETSLLKAFEALKLANRSNKQDYYIV
jgi:GGDEF domain-containing protein